MSFQPHQQESIASKIISIFGLCIVMPTLITYSAYSYISGSTDRRLRENTLLNHKTDTEMFVACLHSGRPYATCKTFKPQVLPQ